MVFGVQNPVVYRALLALALGTGAWLALRESRQTAGSLAAWLTVAIMPGPVGRLARLH